MDRVPSVHEEVQLCFVQNPFFDAGLHLLPWALPIAAWKPRLSQDAHGAIRKGQAAEP